MPEHVHLLLHPRHADYSISAILTSVKQPVSTAAIRYIHLNPVRRGLVARPEDWPGSSAPSFAGEPTPLLPLDLASLPH